MTENKTNAYGIKKDVPFSFEDTISKVTETLKSEGFGILTEIDVKATLKKKLDEDFTDYTILGACNPPLAFEALSSEIDIGLLLPCNVVVYKNQKSEGVTVAAIDPVAMVKVTGREDLDQFAEAVRSKLDKAIAKV